MPDSASHPVHRSRSVLARLLLIVLCAVTPVLALVLWTGVQLQRTADQLALQEADRALTAFENQKRLVLHSSRQLLLSMSLWPSIVERNTERLSDLLADQFALYDTYATILITDLSGVSIASSHPGATGISYADRDYFQEVVRTRRFAVGSLVASRTTGSPVVPFALPVFDDAGRLDSVLVASYLVDDYHSLFSGGVVPDGWTAEIVDRHGVFLFRHPLRAATPLGIAVAPQLLELLRSTHRYRGIWIDGDGREQYVLSAAVFADPREVTDPSSADFYLIMRAPEEVALVAGRNLVVQLVLLALVSLLFTAVMTTVLGRRTIIRRLGSLVAASDAIACGDYSVRSGVAYDRGEIGAVASAFDAMAEALQAREDAHEIAERTISASLAEKEVLLQEIHHRVKNNFQIISSLLRMQSDGVDDERVRAQFRDAENRIRSMALIHESLYQSDSTAEIDFKHYLGTVIRSIHTSSLDRESAIEIEVNSDPVRLSLDRAVPLALIVNELVSNSCKHAFPSGVPATGVVGRIEVRLTQRDSATLELLVADNGRRNGDASSRAGLGTLLIQALTDQLQGTLEYSFDAGTRCLCRFLLRGQRDAPPEQID